MRFGIMALQIGLLIPSQATPGSLASGLAGFSHAALVRQVAQPAFKAIELSGDLALFFPQAFAPGAIAELAALKAELGLAYTVHLPLWSVELSTLLTPVRLGSVRALIDVIQATLPLEPDVYVLHATGALAAEFYRLALPGPAHSLILGQFQARAAESIRHLLRETGIASRRLAVETIEFPLEATLELADSLDLSMCLDTGHVLAGFSGPADLPGALERCLPRLAEVHFHDAARPGPDGRIVYGTDHRPLGAGDLDIAPFLDRLQAAGFGGPLILALSVEQALASLDWVRRLRPGVLE